MPSDVEFEPLRVPGFIPLYTAAIGAFPWIVHNRWAKKPINSRIFLGLGYMAAGYFLGHYYEYRAILKAKERDLVVLDYIKRHPEDFPEMTPPKYKEVLLPWTPQR